MRKTLGPLIEIILPEYQEYLAKIMTEARGSSVHRGMLSFIPIPEMMAAIMTQDSLNFSQNLQGLQQMVTQPTPWGTYPPRVPTPIKTPLYGRAIYNHLLVMLTSLSAVPKMDGVRALPSDNEDDDDAPPNEKALSYL